MRKQLITAIIAVAAINGNAQNGPTMGWSSWNTYGVNINEALIKKRAMAQSGERYVLCTADKFHIISPVQFAAFTEATIITDRYPNAWYAEQDTVICVGTEEESAQGRLPQT